MIFKYTNGNDKDFIYLCTLLDDYLTKIAGGEENMSKFTPYNQLNDIHDVIVVYDNNLPIGCGSFKRYDDKCAEIKRVYVRNEYRRKEIAKNLMLKLENSAKEQGYEYLILETGKVMTSAVSLYSSLGYTKIPNYDQYINIKESLCMKKKI